MRIFHDIFNLKIEDSKNRLYYLDYIRGILIILVMYHHSSAPLGNYVLQFHMPALFILSGYTEYLIKRKKTFQLYIKSKFFRLIVPYFFFEVLNLLLYVLLQFVLGGDSVSYPDAFISILTGINNSYIGLYGRLWFLPAMFLSAISAYLIKNYLSAEKPVIIAIWCMVMFILSHISYTLIPYRLPFTIDISFLGTAFFLAGHLAGEFLEKIFRRKFCIHDLCIFVISVALFVLCNVFADPLCHMYINNYNDFPIMIVCALTGTISSLIIIKMVIPVFEKMVFLRKFILWYSLNSLAVFPVHLIIKAIGTPFLSRIGINHWLSLLILMMILTIPLVNAITSYFPFMLGEFNKNNH